MTKREILNLLYEIRKNKEITVFGSPKEQYDAKEPRYEVKIIGPERLMKKLIDGIWA